MSAPVIDTRTSLLIPERNKAFSYTPVATGSPTLWEAPGLPAGLAINASTGTISGTPTVAGVLGFVLRASNFVSRVAVADASADTLTSNGHPYQNGDLVDFTTTGTLPAPLTVSTLYEVRDVTGSAFKVAAAPGGPAIDLTNTGSGTHTVRKKQSDEVSVIMPILDTTSVITTGDETAVEMDIDVITGKVTVLGVESVDWSPPLATPAPSLLRRALLLIQPGERFRALVGFVRQGRLQDLEIETLQLLAKEYATESSISLNGGVFEKVGSGDLTRYRTIVDVNTATWSSLLSSYEAETGTYHDALGQVRYSLGTPPDLYTETETSTGIAIQGGLTGGTKIERTLQYRSLPEFADEVPASLSVSLAVAGRPLQALAIEQTLNLDFSTPNWVVSDLTGTDTATGATEGTKWKATMEVVSVTAVSGGVDVDVEITTTNDTTIPVAYVEISGSADGLFLSNPGDGEASELTISTDYELELWPGNDEYSDTIIGTWVPQNTYDNAAAFAAALLAGWESTSGENDVVSVTYTLSPLTFRINLESTTDVTHIRWGDPGVFRAITPSSIIGTPTTATLTGVLAQTADPWAVPFTRISELFVLRAMDSMTVPG
jgi:hypothetical protein